MGHPEPVPFQLNVPEAVLEDLKDRLSNARLPDEPPHVDPWVTGAGVAYMSRLIEYWRNGFDWRAQEAMLNSFPQFSVPLAGIELHFIHERGKGPDAMPLLLSHGWPGSVAEFYKLIPMLTDPVRYGADPADAFTVVAPSLPGYTLSYNHGQNRFGVDEIAETFLELMTGVLGYDRFGAQGGDWGAFIASRLAYRYPRRLHGIHLNMLVRSTREVFETAEERACQEQMDKWRKEETGYQWIQGTRPTTLAYGLTDSPAGLAAWIVEKFRAWTDNTGEPDSAVSLDEMLTNITLYWVTGAVGSSFWPYYALRHGARPIPEGGVVTVPTGYVEFPREIMRPPRSVAERTFTNITRWTVMANVLEVPLEHVGDLSLSSSKPSMISSTCTVFAESEVVSLRARGEPRENLIAGIHKGIASRVVTMGRSIGFSPEVAFTGGVAKNAGMKQFLESSLGLQTFAPEEPQIVGALGAALLALDSKP